MRLDRGLSNDILFTLKIIKYILWIVIIISIINLIYKKGRREVPVRPNQ